MLKNAYLPAKIGAGTDENEQNFASPKMATTRCGSDPIARRRG